MSDSKITLNVTVDKAKLEEYILKAIQEAIELASGDDLGVKVCASTSDVKNTLKGRLDGLSESQDSGVNIKVDGMSPSEAYQAMREYFEEKDEEVVAPYRLLFDNAEIDKLVREELEWLPEALKEGRYYLGADNSGAIWLFAGCPSKIHGTWCAEETNGMAATCLCHIDGNLSNSYDPDTYEYFWTIYVNTNGEVTVL